MRLPGAGLLRAADFERAFEIGLRLCRIALQTNISTTRSADTIRRFRDRAVSDNPIFLKQCENIYEGMRKAGVPE